MLNYFIILYINYSVDSKLFSDLFNCLSILLHAKEYLFALTFRFDKFPCLLLNSFSVWQLHLLIQFFLFLIKVINEISSVSFSRIFFYFYVIKQYSKYLRLILSVALKKQRFYSIKFHF